MTVTINSGHMVHGTTEVSGPALSEISTKTGNPGGELAKSSEERLSGAFPASPMMGRNPDYKHDEVTKLRKKLLTNTVTVGDAAYAASYYGYPAPTSEEIAPSSADLSYSGAPVIKNVTKDIDGNSIASPWHANLCPPDQFDPIMDNPVPIIMDDTISQKAISLADPSKSSAIIHKHSADGNQTLPGSAASGATP